MYKSFVILLIVCILPLILLKAVKYQKFDAERLNNIKFPITHWIMMGLNKNKNGVYSQSDVDYTISFPNVLTKKEQCLFLCSIIFFELVLFFIIWETRSRYLVNYIPVLLLNMFVGIDYCLNLLNSKINKKEGE